MNNALSAICFLVDELVFGKTEDGKDIIQSRRDYNRFIKRQMDQGLAPKPYEQYVLEFEGATQDTIFFKDLLTGKKLA